jgi:hypothetical protein
VQGAWCMVHGVWRMAYGIWCMAYGAWCMVHGVWRMVHGVWCVWCVWCMVHSECVPFDKYSPAPPWNPALVEIAPLRKLTFEFRM